MKSRLFWISVLLLSSLALGACGKKGPPLRPADVQAKEQANVAEEDEQKAGATEAAKPDRPFILDGLL